MNKQAWMHAALVGAAATFLSTLATTLPSLSHSPTLRGALFFALMATLSKTLGLVVNLIGGAPN